MNAQHTRAGGKHVAIERGALIGADYSIARPEQEPLRPIIRRVRQEPGRAPFACFLSQRSLEALLTLFPGIGCKP
jgi:hypothetical protein